jgi:hypothetical protein
VEYYNYHHPSAVNDHKTSLEERDNYSPRGSAGVATQRSIAVSDLGFIHRHIPNLG